MAFACTIFGITTYCACQHWKNEMAKNIESNFTGVVDKEPLHKSHGLPGMNNHGLLGTNLRTLGDAAGRDLANTIFSNLGHKDNDLGVHGGHNGLTHLKNIAESSIDKIVQDASEHVGSVVDGVTGQTQEHLDKIKGIKESLMSVANEAKEKMNNLVAEAGKGATDGLQKVGETVDNVKDVAANGIKMAWDKVPLEAVDAARDALKNQSNKCMKEATSGALSVIVQQLIRPGSNVVPTAVHSAQALIEGLALEAAVKAADRAHDEKVAAAAAAAAAK